MSNLVNAGVLTSSAKGSLFEQFGTTGVTTMPSVRKSIIHDGKTCQYLIALPGVTEEELHVKTAPLNPRATRKFHHEASRYHYEGLAEKILRISVHNKDKVKVPKESTTYSIIHQESYSWDGVTELREEQSVETKNGKILIEILLPKTVDTDKYSMKFVDEELIVRFEIATLPGPHETELKFGRAD